MHSSTSQPPRVLICVSGSVATVKLPEIVYLCASFAQVRVVVTNSASHFVGLCRSYNRDTWDKWLTIRDRVLIYSDQDEWDAYSKVGVDPVVHIELRKWADLILIAPLSANTMAKLSHGICDNLLTSVARAWDHSKPFLVAPAMNTFMWDHPHTRKQLGLMEELGIRVIHPISKILACGDVGTGALAPVQHIVSEVAQMLKVDATGLGVANQSALSASACRPIAARDHDIERIAAIVANEECGSDVIENYLTSAGLTTQKVVAVDTATGVVLGAALHSTGHDLESDSLSVVTTIHFVVVDAAHRRHGIGKLLVKAVENAACQQGSTRVDMQGAADYQTVKNFCISAGYQEHFITSASLPNKGKPFSYVFQKGI